MPDATGATVEPFGGTAGPPTRPVGIWGTLTGGFRTGTLFFAFGTAMAAAFGPEIVKTLVTDESAGRWWYVGLSVLAIGLLFWGIELRRRDALRATLGIAVAAADGDQFDARGRTQARAAVEFVERTFPAGFKIQTALATDPLAQLDALAGRVHDALAVAPPAASVGLVPVLRLHAAFHLGARLGYNHRRDVLVFAEHAGSSVTTHFPATMLLARPPQSLRRRRGPAPATDLRIEALRRIDDARGNGVALALDLQARGENEFHRSVWHDCRERGYGWVLAINRDEAELDRDYDTFTAVIDRIVAVWRAVQLPREAGPVRGIYLSGPPVIALALGARLGAAKGAWTAYTWDKGRGRYVGLADPS